MYLGNVPPPPPEEGIGDDLRSVLGVFSFFSVEALNCALGKTILILPCRYKNISLNQ